MEVAIVTAICASGLACVVWAWAVGRAYSSEDRVVRHMLRAAPAKRIGDMAENEVGKVAGRARVLDEVLTAPLTGRRCVYVIAIVDELRLDVERSKAQRTPVHSWQTIIHDIRSVPFIVDDATGRAVVDATAARIAIEFDTNSESGRFDAPTAGERALRAPRPGCPRVESPAALPRGRHRGWRDDRGAGAGTREPDPEAPPTDAYRGEPRTRLRLTSSPRHPLVISDDPSTTR